MQGTVARQQPGEEFKPPWEKRKGACSWKLEEERVGAASASSLYLDLRLTFAPSVPPPVPHLPTRLFSPSSLSLLMLVYSSVRLCIYPPAAWRIAASPLTIGVPVARWALLSPL